MEEKNNGFLKRADAHIALANEQMVDGLKAGDISASFMYGAARFNAWMAAASFETKEDCRQNLIKIKRQNKKLKIHLNFFALGEKKKIKTFYKNSKNALSSFFKVNTNSKLFINMKKQRKNKNFISGINLPTKIQQDTLSNYFKINKIKNVDILKIDTQGYDENVLKGLKSKDLNKIKVINLEMNFYDFYEKSNSFLNVEKIIGNHFNFWDISFLYKNPKFNSIDYMDVIYINKSFQKKITS